MHRLYKLLIVNQVIAIIAAGKGPGITAILKMLDKPGS
jgi:hypothetical protein